MTAVIEVDGFRFRYPGAGVESLRGVDLTVEQGDFVAVVGGNGSGKTTLCKAFNGLVPHYWSGRTEGSVTVSGVPTATSTVAELSTVVGYVYQDFSNQLVRPTVRDEVSFAAVNFGLPDHAARTQEALEMLQITHLADRFVWQLSGGQQHLVAIAAVMVLRPQVLVVDEPVAELDPGRAAQIYECLARLNASYGTTIVVIEHHTDLVARYARSVVLMADGAVVWHLPVAEAMARSAELDAHGVPAPQVVQVARAFERTGPVPLTPADAARWLADRGIEARPAAPTGPTGPAGGTARPVVARLDDVRHGYRGVDGRLETVLAGVDLDLHEGERVALVGSNGAGKSTMLRLLTGLRVPRAGTVTVEGVSTRDVSPSVMADRVCYLYQRPEEMFLTDSVRGDVALYPKGRDVPDADGLVDEVLALVDLQHLADRDGRTLSGGQQRRATLAVGLAMRPSLLLLDEPTSSLDIGSRDGVIAMLARLADHIRCVVVATHDMHLVAEWATRVIVLDHGDLVADTTPSRLFGDATLTNRVGLVPPQVAQLGRALGMDPPPLSVTELVARTGARPHAHASASGPHAGTEVPGGTHDA
ncbi:ABC transporter ATP-binding protein [Sanguibacter suaedae]|uniref:Energy-coupling factor ABC transporter ATP-binding protein n=1 Tax=Sanguibacter suaedae TaxID=2795737 RepID=A0A934MAE4_9MICO|nr:ABC transporter ATP-binding protein [Sanguibacter suaedae]MBI9114146.1 energy-coupling factor ABC transporter ATP-binding protein [Sanguibacter suaedae]